MSATDAQLHVVVGLGQTGLSCARFLARQGLTVAVTDSRIQPPGADALRQDFPLIQQSLAGFDDELLAQAHCLIVSPGISLQEPAIIRSKAKGIEIIGDVELFVRHAQAPIVAITGTNGKSTVTALLGEMLRQAGHSVQVGGNIGIPVLDLLALPVPEWYVLELSSFQLETTTSLQASTATILNVSPDHLDRYADFTNYHAAKQRVYHNAKQAVVNRDDALTIPTQDMPAVSFGLSEPVLKQYGLRKQEGQICLSCGDNPLIAVNQLAMRGRQNWANALAALALGQTLGLPIELMLTTLHSFSGLAHRCQWLRELHSVNWYNDSKATNTGACIAALQGLGADLNGKIVLIAGGQAKDADFKPLRQAVKQQVRQLIVMGEDADKLQADLANLVPISRAKDLEEAVMIAQSTAQSGDAVLLAPACASFDMFDNFAHRGEVFSQLVEQLP